MKNTHKILAAAVAVLFAIMPVSVEAQVRHTEDTYYMQYQEGQEVGSLTYAGDTYSVLYGVSQEVVDSGNIELFGLSAQDHLMMFAHNDRAFSKLLDNSRIGTKINVTMNDNSVWYEVFNAFWIDEKTWYTEQYMFDLYYTDTTPLTLITCNHHGTTRGRWVVQCTYSSEPVLENAACLPPITDTNTTVEEIETTEIPVVEIPVEEVTFVEAEETQTYENEAEIAEIIEETQVSALTRLNIMRMKRIWVYRRIEFLNRGL